MKASILISTLLLGIAIGYVARNDRKDKGFQIPKFPKDLIYPGTALITNFSEGNIMVNAVEMLPEYEKRFNSSKEFVTEYHSEVQKAIGIGTKIKYEIDMSWKSSHVPTANERFATFSNSGMFISYGRTEPGTLIQMLGQIDLHYALVTEDDIPEVANFYESLANQKGWEPEKITNGMMMKFGEGRTLKLNYSSLSQNNQTGIKFVYRYRHSSRTR